MKAGGLLLVAMLLAGCSAAPAAPAGLPIDSHGRALPTVQGTVVDSAIRPLEGVRVRILGTDLATTTDAQGHYELRRPTLKPEAALVSASKDGFEPRTGQAQVSGHRSATLDFRLDADDDVVPHVDVLEHRGTLRCSAVVRTAAGSQGANCADDRGDDAAEIPAWMWDVIPTPNLAGAVVEVRWEASSPLSQRAHAWLKAPMAGGQGGETLAETTGESPLRLEVPADVARSFGRWTALRLHVELADPDGTLPVGVGASDDQPYTAYASLFYVDPAPPGYALGA